MQILPHMTQAARYAPFCMDFAEPSAHMWEDLHGQAELRAVPIAPPAASDRTMRR